MNPVKYAFLISLLFLLSLVSLQTGVVSSGWNDFLRALASGPSSHESFTVILWQLRLPRTVLALLVGGTLGLSGAVMQGLFRNPLAEPGITGVTGGGVLGAVAVLYFSAGHFPGWVLCAGAMTGALIATAVLFGLAEKLESVFALILAGVVLNTFFFALTGLLLNLAPNPYSAIEMIFWQMGSLADLSWNHLAWSAPFLALGWRLLFSVRRELDVLTLGEEAAGSLGVALRSVYLRAVAGTAFAVGAAVAVCGSIGFVGLIVPHVMRRWFSERPSDLLMPSFLGGALLTLTADLIVRRFPWGSELNIGIVTALMGVPFFIALLWQWKRKVA